jgi:hypothetical protein
VRGCLRGAVNYPSRPWSVLANWGSNIWGFSGKISRSEPARRYVACFPTNSCVCVCLYKAQQQLLMEGQGLSREEHKNLKYNKSRYETFSDLQAAPRRIFSLQPSCSYIGKNHFSSSSSSSSSSFLLLLQNDLWETATLELANAFYESGKVTLKSDNISQTLLASYLVYTAREAVLKLHIQPTQFYKVGSTVNFHSGLDRRLKQPRGKGGRRRRILAEPLSGGAPPTNK